MPSSASSTESQTESQSSRGPHITQWLPQLVLVALLAITVASIIGVSFSAVAFRDAEGLGKPGHGIAQSFVMFASMTSLFYIPLHLSACRKGESLYFDPPIPSFRHQLHAWATLIIHITAAMWASATIPVAVAIYRGGGGGGASTTARLNVDMFACATGLLFSSVILAVVHLAHRPFTLPWLSPPVFDEEDTSSGGGEFDKFDDKTATTSSSGSSSTLRGSPPVVQRALLPSSGATSRSTSTTRSRARKMTRTKRYVLEAPTPPIPLSPPQPLLKRGGSLSGAETDGEAGVSTAGSSGSSGSGGGSSRAAPASKAASTAPSSGTGKLRLEDELVPSAGESESYFAAASSAGSSLEVKGKGGVVVGVVEVGGRPATPEGRGRGYVPPRRQGKGGAAGGGRRRAGESPSLFRFGRKTAARVVEGGGAGDGGGRGGGGGGGDGVGKGVAAEPSAPPPAPAPSPPPTYCVPGAWVAQGQLDEDMVGDV